MRFLTKNNLNRTFLFLVIVLFNAGLWFTFAKYPFLKKTSESEKSKIINSYGKLPLSFEPNQGQAAPQVKFLSRSGGYDLYLTDQEAVLVLLHPDHGRNKDHGTILRKSAVSHSEVVRLKLKNSQIPSSVEGLEKLPGISNYFIGKDPKRWHTNIPQYAKVQLKNVYPGVDVVYYGNQGRLEHDFIVAAGADPKAIRLQIDGARQARVDAKGNLILMTQAASVVLKAPLVYQMKEGQKQIVQARYELKGKELAFAVENYDVREPLVIDPTLVYSTYLGGGSPSANDVLSDFAVDSSGNAYLTETRGASFPTTAGVYEPNNTTGGDTVLVVKLNPTGTGLVYATYVGGSAADASWGIALDSSNNAYVTGITCSTDFPTTAGCFQSSFQSTATGSYFADYGNSFVFKLNPTGTGLVYSTYLGGNTLDLGEKIVVDSSGNSFITGSTSSTNFPKTAGCFQSSLNGTINAFVTKLNSTGTALIFSTYLGGNGTDYGFGITFDGTENSYLTGFTTSTNFPTSAGCFQSAFGGTDDVFISKINPTGTALIYSTYLGASSTSRGNAITVDTAGNAFVTGYTAASNFPTTSGCYQSTLAGSGSNVFVTKLNPSGTGLVYSTYLGGSTYDSGQGIQIDSGGNAYVAGLTASNNFPTTSGSLQGPSSSSYTGFFTILNPTGTALSYSTYWGGGEDYGKDLIQLGSSGVVYLAGEADDNTLTITSGAYDPTAALRNMWISKFSFANTPTQTATSTPVAVSSMGCSVLLYYDNEGNGEDMTNMVNVLKGAGANVVSIGVNSSTYNPASDNWGNYNQVWDGRFYLSAQSFCPATDYGDYLNSNWQSTAVTYIQAGGSFFLEGENNGFPSRNDANGNGQFLKTLGVVSNTFISCPSASGPFASSNDYSGAVNTTSTLPVSDPPFYGDVVGGIPLTLMTNSAYSFVHLATGWGHANVDRSIVQGWSGASEMPGLTGSNVGKLFMCWDSSMWNPSDFPGNSATITTFFQAAYVWLGGMACTTSTSTPTAISTSTVTCTNTPTFTVTYTVTNTPTGPLSTSTSTSTATSTVTATNTSTPTISFTPTNTPTVTPTFTPTFSPTPTCVIYAWPDPYNPDSSWKGYFQLSCLPAGAIVSFYTLSGELVQTVNTSGGMAQWNGRNHSGYPVASGIYFYVVQSGGKAVTSGKFLIVR